MKLVVHPFSVNHQEYFKISSLIHQFCWLGQLCYAGRLVIFNVHFVGIRNCRRLTACLYALFLRVQNEPKGQPFTRRFTAGPLKRAARSLYPFMGYSAESFIRSWLCCSAA
jgi:hypothetical protein